MKFERKNFFPALVSESSSSVTGSVWVHCNFCINSSIFDLLSSLKSLELYLFSFLFICSKFCCSLDFFFAVQMSVSPVTWPQRLCCHLIDDH